MANGKTLVHFVVPMWSDSIPDARFTEEVDETDENEAFFTSPQGTEIVCMEDQGLVAINPKTKEGYYWSPSKDKPGWRKY